MMMDDSDGWAPPRLATGNIPTVGSPWTVDRRPQPSQIAHADRLQAIDGLLCAFLIQPSTRRVVSLIGPLDTSYDESLAGVRAIANWSDFESSIITRGSATYYALRNPRNEEIVVVAVDRQRANLVLIRKALESSVES